MIFLIVGEWMILDETTAELETLYIYGVLEILNEPSSNIILKTKKIFIDGGRLIVGTEDQPFLGQAEIYLMGNAADEELLFQGNNGPVIGTKAIGKTIKLNLLTY